MTMQSQQQSERTLWGFNSRFWILVVGTLINSTGGALVFPFIALYLGRRFGTTETETGLVFTFYAVVSLFSGAAGGALTDRFGRKTVMVIGLAAAIVFSTMMAFASTLTMVLVAILVTGLLSPIFGPAVNAMITDMLPEERRQRGFGLIRVAANLGVVIGPMLGGLLADRDGGFMWLFLGDALTSGIFALVIWLLIPETKPVEEVSEVKPQEHWTASLKIFDGYGRIIRDSPFVLFSLVYLVSTIVYSQMNTTMVLYMDKEFSMSASQYSMLIALNAAMVVVLQFPLSAYIERFRNARMLALGALLYGVGFGMFAWVGELWWLALGMVVITFGEMIMVPVAQTVVADMSPVDMRGRYMGFYGLVWSVSFGIGPALGGMILQADGGSHRRWLWHAALYLGIAGAAAFLMLGRYLKRRDANQRWANMQDKYGVETAD